jgi:hypothetical protein
VIFPVDNNSRKSPLLLQALNIFLHLFSHAARLKLRRAGKRQSAPGPVSSERSGATRRALFAFGGWATI